MILAGGRATRFGGDKLAAPLYGTSLLDQTLQDLPDSARILVIGPARPTRRTVTFIREDPPYGGPVAAIAAGLRTALVELVQWLAVLPGDTPYAGRSLTPLFAALTAERHLSVGVDPTGRRQPLHLAMDRDGAAAWLDAAGSAVTGVAAREILRRLDARSAPWRPVPVRLAADHFRDVDTTTDLTSLAAAPVLDATR